MRTHANDRLRTILFRIGMNIELPLTAVLLFRSAHCQRIHQRVTGLLIRKIGFGQVG